MCFEILSMHLINEKNVLLVEELKTSNEIVLNIDVMNKNGIFITKKVI